MHFCPAGGHVPQSERNNQFLKDRTRCGYHRLPFKALPRKVVKKLVMEMTRKTNYFPNRHGILKYFSPRQLLLREPLDYETDCKYYFGQYVQAHDDETNPRNSQQSQTLDALYIPAVDRGHEVYNISTDEIITRVKLTPLPISKHIIDTVNDIAARQHQPGLKIQAQNEDVLCDSAWTP